MITEFHYVSSSSSSSAAGIDIGCRLSSCWVGRWRRCAISVFRHSSALEGSALLMLENRPHANLTLERFYA